MENRITVGLNEAASMLGVSIGSINRYIKIGKLPYVKLGNRVLIEVVNLKKLIEEAREPEDKEFDR